MGHLDRLQYGIATKMIGEGDQVFRMGTSVTAERMRRTPGCIYGDMFVISWILTGEGEYREDGISYRLTDGTVCVRRPDRDYFMELAPKESARLYIDLPEPMYRAMLLLVPELAALPPVREAPFRQELFDEFMSLYTAFGKLAADEVYTLLPEMIRFLCKVTGIFDDRERQPLLRAKQMLADPASTLTLPEIAERCGFNYHTFRRDFTAAFGVSPGKFRQTSRMTAACRMLELGLRGGTGDQVMEEIAGRLSEEASQTLEQRVAQVEPAMVLAASLLVGIILLSVMLPLMHIMSAIG